MREVSSLLPMPALPPSPNHHLVSADEAGQRVDRYLKRLFPLVPHTLIHKWLRSGQIRLNSARVKPDIRIQENDAVRLPPEEITNYLRTSEDIPTHKKVHAFDNKTLSLLRKRILLEQEDFFLLDKPVGLACQGGRGITQALDKQLLALAETHPSLGTPRLVHRLDRATSGLLLVAKSRRAAASLASLFQLGKVQKTYCAILTGTPKENVREKTKLKPKTKTKEKLTPPKPSILTYHTPLSDKRKGEQEAMTHLYPLAHNDVYDNSLVLLRPVSGRKHQLRRHLADAGIPIVGEKLYSSREKTSGNRDNETIQETIVESASATEFAKPTDRLMLHALRLVIAEEEGSGYTLDIHLPPPLDFLAACCSLRLDQQGLKDSRLDPFV